MLLRPSPLQLLPQRRSPAALVTVGALHVALLWLIAQHLPVERAVRYVVYQYVTPTSPGRNAASSRAITVPSSLPLRASEALDVFSNRVDPSVPLKATTQLPDTLQARKPRPGPKARRAAETEAEPAPQQVQPLPVPVAPAPEPDPLPTPAPVLPEPVPVPAPVPAPEPAPAPVPAPEPAPPAPVPAPPAAAPAPPPAAVPSSPAPAPAQRLQAPTIDVPVPAGSPAAVGATPILVPAPPGWGSPVPAAPAPAPLRPAPPPAIVVPAIPPHPGPFRIQQRSLADMANEQLRRGAKPRPDPMAEGMGEAAVDDCLNAPAKPALLGGLLAAPVLAARGLSGKCAK